MHDSLSLAFALSFPLKAHLELKLVPSLSLSLSLSLLCSYGGKQRFECYDCEELSKERDGDETSTEARADQAQDCVRSAPQHQGLLF